jgi:hypothetical protein
MQADSIKAMSDSGETLELFAAAAVDWAAGGRGHALVDAAAQALATGLDSPTLRILAGASQVSAEEEALDLAPTVFEELGLVIATRLSAAAIVDGARQRALRFLRGDDVARELARDLWRMYVAADYPEELADFSGLDDWYDMIETGVVDGRVKDVDRATADAARALVGRDPTRGVALPHIFRNRRATAGTRVWSWAANADEIDERRSHARRLVGLELRSVRYRNLDYYRDDIAPELTGPRSIVDATEWADPIWRYPDGDSIDFGLELETKCGRTFSVTWDPPGEIEGIGIRESPLVCPPFVDDANVAIWDVSVQSGWLDLVGQTVRDVVLRYLPWHDPPGPEHWCPRISLQFDHNRVELLLGEGSESKGILPSADNVAVLFDPRGLPPWEQSRDLTP